MKSWYSNFVAKIYDPFMHSAEEKVFAHKRKTLLHKLQGQILDVGSGTGVNFQYFGEEAYVTAIEPNHKMMKYAQAKLSSSSNIELLLGGIGDENINFKGQSFDYIISTLVLCSIPDPNSALRDFHQWLKPNGELILIEHIRSHNHFTGIGQDIINPAWKLVADGCNLNRNTHEMVKNAGFKVVSENFFNVGFRWFEGIYRK